MAKKTIILTQKQLDEIVGGNMAYFDDGSEYTEDATNQVYTDNPKFKKTKTTGDKVAKSRRRDSSFYGLNRNIQTKQPVMIACSKSDWEKKNLNEENQDLVNRTFHFGQSEKNKMSGISNSAGANAAENGMSYTNATTIKSRMNKLQQQAQKGDAQAQQKYQNMGGKVLQDTVEKKLDNATTISKRDKENRSNMGFNNVYQKPGGTKVSGNGKAHTPKNAVITYDNPVN